MRTNRILAIATAFGLGVPLAASANVAYDSETTNVWFSANMGTVDLTKSPWTKPTNGEATVKAVSSAKVIGLDTDFDDPLIYTASGTSEDVAVVAAEMTATLNASTPGFGEIPQAALTVIGTSSATNWVGLVGDGNGGTNWVTFPSPIPVAGESYSVRIEFDQRETKKIRYLIDGVVLAGAGSSDGWYPNPQTGTSSIPKISKVSFSGSGDIAALAGENIIENTIAFTAPTATEGYDYTNGAISVSATIQGYSGVQAVLKVRDFETGEVKEFAAVGLGSSPVSWDLTELLPGGLYDYTIEAQVGGRTVATKTGTFATAKWPAGIWFGADATGGGDDTTGGDWDPEMSPVGIEGNAYVIDDGALFNVDEQTPGSNHVTRVDANVTFESLVDAGSIAVEDDALGGFVAAKSGEIPQWMALSKVDQDVGWVVLTGDISPMVNAPYVIRAEVDFLSALRCVRYFVSNDGGANFHPLADGSGRQWIPLADETRGSLAAVELKGSGRIAKFEATVADKALAAVDGVEYDSMEDALEAAKAKGKSITLLTNATIDPEEEGEYDIVPGGYQYMFDGTVSDKPRTIIVDEGGGAVVRPSKEIMNGVKTPGDKPYRDINSLRRFLEKNHVGAYTTDTTPSSGEITEALSAVPENSNGLTLWEDYVMGIEPTDPLDPVTRPAGDTADDGITLSIPKVAAATPSGDYTLSFKVVDATDETAMKGAVQTDAGAIKVPLETGKYRIKVIFTATPAN